MSRGRRGTALLPRAILGPAPLIALVVLPLAVLSVREHRIAKAELALSDDAASRGEWADAVVHAQAAAQARAPGSPWPDRAAERLQSLARDAELRGDSTTALMAFGALRAAAVATSGLGVPRAEWLGASDRGIRRLSLGELRANGGSGEASHGASALRGDEPAQPDGGESGDSPGPGPLARGLLSSAAWSVAIGMALVAAALLRFRSGAKLGGALVAAGIAVWAVVLLLN